MSRCIFCEKEISNISICEDCIKSPLKVESLRKYFIENNDLINFNKTYSRKYSKIHNGNTRQFWNKKFLHSVENSSAKNENFMERNKIDDVLSFLKKEKGKLLDIGIGLGKLEEKLFKINKGIEFWGVDSSNYAIDLIKEKVPGNFIKASIFDVVFKNEFFDVICCLDLLEHISSYKTLHLLDKIFRFLKPNGKLIITVPLNEGLEDMIKKGFNPNHHVRAYSSEILETELKLSNFDIISKKYYIAFRKMYKIKSLFCKFFVGIRRPNLMMVVAQKK